MGQPAIIPLLIGGAIGGALPDIDVDSGAAIEKMGSKAARLGNKAVSKLGGKKLGRILIVLGTLFDKYILVPLCRLWRWVADNIISKIYKAIYNIPITPKQKTKRDKNGKETIKTVNNIGELAGWDNSDPSTHRGGVTHSFTFLLTSCIMTIPIALVFNSLPFWVGCELGILSHLVADSMCRSGVKYFWPWLPKIGFPDIHGKNVGDGIRIMPASLLVKTGCDSWTNDYIDNEFNNEKERLEARKLRRREKGWQKVFQMLALALITALIITGGVSMTFVDKANAKSQNTPQQTTAMRTQQESNNTQNQNQQQANTTGGEETPGPTSLTYGDLAVSSLPKGIMKMPDESLWVIGVGPVTEENLNNPKWTFTDDEKSKLLKAAKAQRASDIPTNLANTASNAFSAAGNAINDATNSASNASGSTGSGLSGLLSDLFGVNTSGKEYTGGFIGLTPYTSGNGNTNDNANTQQK